MSKAGCSICGKKFDRNLVDAVQIGRKGVGPLYQFANGEVRSLGSTKLGRRKNAVKPAKEKSK